MSCAPTSVAPTPSSAINQYESPPENQAAETPTIPTSDSRSDPTRSTVVAPAPEHVRTSTAKRGLVPIVERIRTKDRVVFITIDDGGIEEPKTAALLARRGIPVTAFLTKNYVRDNPNFYKRISTSSGQVIQNHTVTHPQLPQLTQSHQREEICQNNTALKGWYGQQPWLLRPPYGEANETTQRAAKACGIKYIVQWRVNMPEGGHGRLQYDDGPGFIPGDIILAHWRHDLHKDLAKVLKSIRQQGFRVAALQDYLPRS